MNVMPEEGSHDAGVPSARPDRIIPRIREVETDPARYARDTCGPAGQLVHGNAGWRSSRPVVDAAACTGCLSCYMHCPDGAVFKVAGAVSTLGRGRGSGGGAPIDIDLGFCKGCGICAAVCRFHALSMVPEKEA